MLEPALGILRTLVTMLVVMGVGAFARKKGLVSEGAALGMRRLVADVCFPALCFVGLAEMGRGELAKGFVVIVLGFFVLALAAAVGLTLARFVTRAHARPSFAFAVAVGNWIFFPLPIAKLLFGAEGVRVVLLFNAGAQVFLWTLGMAMLHRGGASNSKIPRALTNVGLWATFAGLGAALFWPGAAHAPVFSDALALVGSMTVPLAAMAIGASLVGDESTRDHPPRDVALCTFGRLIAAPLATLVALAIAVRFAGFALPRPTLFTVLLISAMPVSLTAGTLVPKGEVGLVSRGILVSTLFSAVTVPAFYALAQAVF